MDKKNNKKKNNMHMELVCKQNIDIETSMQTKYREKKTRFWHLILFISLTLRFRIQKYLTFDALRKEYLPLEKIFVFKYLQTILLFLHEKWQKNCWNNFSEHVFFWGELIPIKRYQNTPGYDAEFGVYNKHLIKITEI